MTRYEYGEPTIYEVTWTNGHVERIPAHQVSWPDQGHGGPRRVEMHAEINGRWTLQLSALMDSDIRMIRNVATEDIAI